MFFVYSSESLLVREYKDLASLLDGYDSSHTSEDLFWTLGLKSWVSISDVVTDNLLKKRKFQIPPVTPHATSLKKTQEPENDLDEDTQLTERPEPVEEKTVLKKVNTPQAAPQSAQPSQPAKATQVTPPTPQIPQTKPPEIEKTVIKSQEDPNFKIVSYEPAASKGAAGQNQTANVTENKRKTPRYDIRLKVIISNKEKTFLSYTSNVSMGGVALEDNIPSEFFTDAKDTEIFISSPKKNEFLAFRCEPVGDETDPKRFSFGLISQESLNKFQQWIDKLKG